MTNFCTISTPVGILTALSDGMSITEIQIGNLTAAESCSSITLPIFESLKLWLKIYFDGKNPDFTIDVSPKGTDFQHLVWQLISEIPYGETTSYGSIAKKAALQLNKNLISAQAVGRATGLNPIPILIPCHRVIGCNGALVGYSAGDGISTKIALLKCEHCLYFN